MLALAPLHVFNLFLETRQDVVGVNPYEGVR